MRLYGRDFEIRLKESDFLIEVYNAKNKIDNKKILKYALILEETVFIAEKV